MKKSLDFKLLLFIFCLAFFGLAFFADAKEDLWASSGDKKIILNDDGLILQTRTRANTVSEFLSEQKVAVGDHDMVLPAKDEKIFSGAIIIIQRAKKIKIVDAQKKREVYTFQKTVEEAIWEDNDFTLGGDDFTKPARTFPVVSGMEIKITHVLIKEEDAQEKIPFKTVTNEDDELSWRTKKTTQKGENGILNVKYKVVYYNGEEISRKIISKEKTKDPVDEVVTQGTFVKVGKTHTGVASWYAYTGTLAAANPWLPMGSYVRVTNKDNGKSVIVKINDRGPFGNGRIIDLDKVAFEKIASLGAGVANVKMEVILN